jgi:hypothetical protein
MIFPLYFSDQNEKSKNKNAENAKVSKKIIAVYEYSPPIN